MPPKKASLARKPPESVIYTNGLIYTVDTTADPQWNKNPHEALVIEQGVIRFVGTRAEAESEYLRPNTIHKDLKGGIVLPGFIDTHLHSLEAGNQVTGTCQLPADQDPDTREMAKAIREGVSKQKGTEWLLGFGFSLLPMLDYVQRSRQRNSSTDPKALLDRLIKSQPVVMVEENSKTFWVNSVALERAGIDETTSSEDIHGGIIMKNQFGDPNGLLFENAGNRLLDLALDPSQYLTLPAKNFDGVMWSLRQLAKAGITSICESPCFWSRGQHKVWQRAEQEGRLTCRVSLALWIHPEKNDDEQIDELKALYQDKSKAILRINQVAVQVDGIFLSSTAATLQEYEIDYNITRDGQNCGMTYMTAPRLSGLLRRLQALDKFGRGFDFDLRANGSRGVRVALEAVTGARLNERRHRITGVETVDPQDIPRFKKLGVMANAQPVGDWGTPSQPCFQDLVNLIGKNRAKDAIPLKDLHHAGAKVLLSSDWDLNAKNPLLGIKNAVTRGKQAVDLQTAVEMYTINGAFALRQDDRTGSLTVGKEADLVILDKDIFKIKIQDIDHVNVLQTVVAGREVFRSSDF